MKTALQRLLLLFRQTGSAFVEDNALKLSASLSYYTIFALGPLLMIIISLAGIVYRQDAVEGRIYGELNGLVGPAAATQVQDIITSLRNTQATTTGAIVGGVLLFIGATGVFTEMQDSINYIWSVRAKPKKGWLKFLINRLLSFSLVLGLGFLLLVSLVASALMDLLSERLLRVFPRYDVEMFAGLNMVLLVAVITGLFAIIYKVLPDAIISWRDAFIGAAFTAALFLLGKLGISYYLGAANLGVTYGAAASIIILLIWVYYSSLILYFGAEFTKVFALHAGHGIRPTDTAVFIIKKEAREIPRSSLDT